MVAGGIWPVRRRRDGTRSGRDRGLCERDLGQDGEDDRDRDRGKDPDSVHSQTSGPSSADSEAIVDGPRHRDQRSGGRIPASAASVGLLGAAMPPPAIRPATIADIPFMWDMSFEAAFIPDDERAGWRGAPSHRPTVKYLDGWGRRGDAGVIAEDTDGTALGAAWYRLFAESDRGNGILAHRDVPELAIAIVPEHRGRQIGRDLLAALAETARVDGYRPLLLSVDPANVPRRAALRRMGFVNMTTQNPCARSCGSCN